jgi:phospholipase C
MPRRLLAPLLAACLLVPASSAGATGTTPQLGDTPPLPITPTPPSVAGPPSAGAVAPMPPVKHVWVFVEENKSWPQTFGIGLPFAPYMTTTLPSMGAQVPQYYGIGHSSLDNYIAMVSGQAPAPQTQDDCPDREYHDMAPTRIDAEGQVVDEQAGGDHGCIYPASVTTIADQLEAAGLTWRGYNEGIPAPCSTANSGTTDPNYKRKHNPFVFFRSILDRPSCAANDVGLDQLDTDLQSAATTPNFSFIVPDQCNDAHDMCDDDDPSSLRRADAFLHTWIPKIMASQAYKDDGLIIVAFDEGSDTTYCCGEKAGPNTNAPGGAPGTGGGWTGALMVSPFIRPGTVSPIAYNHYSLLRSLEDIFGLGPHLGFAGQDGLVSFGSDIFTAA